MNVSPTAANRRQHHCIYCPRFISVVHVDELRAAGEGNGSISLQVIEKKMKKIKNNNQKKEKLQLLLKRMVSHCGVTYILKSEDQHVQDV